MLQQKIKLELEPIEKALKYYAVISMLYDLKLNNKQRELLAFTAVRGTITPLSARKDFSERFNSPLSSINNFISQLSRKGLLVKEDKMYRVTKKLRPDFTLDLGIQIELWNLKID